MPVSVKACCIAGTLHDAGELSGKYQQKSWFQIEAGLHSNGDPFQVLSAHKKTLL